jgi:phenylpropionate dioxygenase-like ring-hydroxylating dioxygenase large terminal subunit
VNVIERIPTVSAKTPPNDTLIKNAWYVAAWSNELTQSLLARRIVDEPLVMYRTAAGQAVAFADRCPHRRYPLSKGRLIGDRLECGYHGFTFDPSGTCVAVPGQSRVPGSANVRSYPLVEKQGAVWVWPGDPALADASRIPEHPWVTDWWSITGRAYLKGRAMLLIDNLMDLSHETYLHGNNIGSREVAETPIEAESDGSVVRVTRRMLGVECPPLYQQTTGLQTPIDRSQEIAFYAPCLYVLSIRVAAAGDTGPGYRSKVLYAITPETARTTHDFWAICNAARDRDDHSVDQMMIDKHNGVVKEDLDALEALEAFIVTEEDGAPEVSLGIDRGGLLARRVMADLARAELG